MLLCVFSTSCFPSTFVIIVDNLCVAFFTVFAVDTARANDGELDNCDDVPFRNISFASDRIFCARFTAEERCIVFVDGDDIECIYLCM